MIRLKSLLIVAAAMLMPLVDAVHRDRLRGENHNSTADNNYSSKNNNNNNRNHNDNNKVSKRAKPLDPEDDYYYYDDVDERNNPTNEAPVVPPGFLSPSVREYLDLGKSIPGRPGTDFPVLGKVPYTNFYCDDQEYPGFFADVETRCQAWHYCDIDGRQATFLCPNGTQFSQAVLVCDWWFNVRCELSPKLYAINGRLYQRPTESPTRPHRVITKELLENIFAKK
ncbi:GSCOCG00000378001-RA-CDS [Cotesia congregata]|nr:GSCOCG00000378001-RA-CDS [Cotesia congregata]